MKMNVQINPAVLVQEEERHGHQEDQQEMFQGSSLPQVKCLVTEEGSLEARSLQ